VKIRPAADRPAGTLDPYPHRDGLALPHWPPWLDDTAEHQIRFLPAAGGSAIELTCTCGASIGTRSCWASSEARRIWQEYHEKQETREGQ